MTVDKQTLQQQQQSKDPKERMAGAGADAQRIQSTQAKSGADMTSGGLAARSQAAGGKHDNAVKPEHVLPKEPKELQRGAKDQQCASSHKQECTGKPECPSGQTECASGQAEWASSGKQPQPMQQMPQGAGAASVKAVLQDQAAAKK